MLPGGMGLHWCPVSPRTLVWTKQFCSGDPEELSLPARPCFFPLVSVCKTETTQLLSQDPDGTCKPCLCIKCCFLDQVSLVDNTELHDAIFREASLQRNTLGAYVTRNMLMWQGVFSTHKWILFLGAQIPQNTLSLAEDEGSPSSPLSTKSLQERCINELRL